MRISDQSPMQRLADRPQTAAKTIGKPENPAVADPVSSSTANLNRPPVVSANAAQSQNVSYVPTISLGKSASTTDSGSTGATRSPSQAASAQTQTDAAENTPSQEVTSERLASEMQTKMARAALESANLMAQARKDIQTQGSEIANSIKLRRDSVADGDRAGEEAALKKAEILKEAGKVMLAVGGANAGTAVPSAARLSVFA